MPLQLKWRSYLVWGETSRRRMCSSFGHILDIQWSAKHQTIPLMLLQFKWRPYPAWGEISRRRICSSFGHILDIKWSAKHHTIRLMPLQLKWRSYPASGETSRRWIIIQLIWSYSWYWVICEASYDSTDAFTAEMKVISSLGKDLEKANMQLIWSYSRYWVTCEASYDSTDAFTAKMKVIFSKFEWFSNSFFQQNFSLFLRIWSLSISALNIEIFQLFSEKCWLFWFVLILSSI